jgi:hypothetical protein
LRVCNPRIGQGSPQEHSVQRSGIAGWCISKRSASGPFQVVDVGNLQSTFGIFRVPSSILIGAIPLVLWSISSDPHSMTILFQWSAKLVYPLKHSHGKVVLEFLPGVLVGVAPPEGAETFIVLGPRLLLRGGVVDSAWNERALLYKSRIVKTS